MTDTPRLVIVGGGITGLAAAYRFLSRRIEGGVTGKVTLLESEPRLGGKILTERVNGFVIEGGPDSFLSYKPRGIGLCDELGLTPRLHGTNPRVRRTYVMRAGRLHQLPEGLTGLVPSRFGPMLKSGLISPLGKLRMGLDFVLPPRVENGDEALASFVRRRLGGEVYERLVEPLMSGIYAGDGEQMSLAATFPQLRQAELSHRSLIRGVLASRSNKESPSVPHMPAPPFVALETGQTEIVEALEARLGGADIRRGVRTVGVEAAPEGSGFTVGLENGERLWADAVVMATPAHVSARLVSGLDDEMAEALSRIPHVSTATVSLAYVLRDVPRPLDGYGYIVPRVEARPILACTWTSTKFPHRAPEGHALVRVFIGRAGREDIVEADDETLVQLAREELRQVLGVTAPPELARVFRWPKAMPQYTLGHLERVAAIERRLAAHPGLFVAGNAYRGIGIPDCIASGERAAEAAIAHLHQVTQDRVSA